MFFMVNRNYEHNNHVGWSHKLLDWLESFWENKKKFFIQAILDGLKAVLSKLCAVNFFYKYHDLHAAHGFDPGLLSMCAVA